MYLQRRQLKFSHLMFCFFCFSPQSLHVKFFHHVGITGAWIVILWPKIIYFINIWRRGENLGWNFCDYLFSSWLICSPVALDPMYKCMPPCPPDFCHSDQANIQAVGNDFRSDPKPKLDSNVIHDFSIFCLMYAKYQSKQFWIKSNIVSNF